MVIQTGQRMISYPLTSGGFFAYPVVILKLTLALTGKLCEQTHPPFRGLHSSYLSVPEKISFAVN